MYDFLILKNKFGGIINTFPIAIGDYKKLAYNENENYSVNNPIRNNVFLAITGYDREVFLAAGNYYLLSF